jgi:nicotinamide riboside kinase
MRKVALTGAHGTGKSTLSDIVTRQLQSKYRISHTPEAPRLFIEELGDPSRFQRGNNSFAWQTLLLARQIEIESAPTQTVDLLICDRTIVDHWAYTQVLFPEQSKTPEGLAWRSIVQRWARTYELIVYLPIEFQIENDGVREVDKAFQQEVDQAISAIYAQFEIKIETLRGSLASRTESFLSMILRPRLL